MLGCQEHPYKVHIQISRMISTISATYGSVRP